MPAIVERCYYQFHNPFFNFLSRSPLFEKEWEKCKICTYGFGADKKCDNYIPTSYEMSDEVLEPVVHNLTDKIPEPVLVEE